MPFFPGLNNMAVHRREFRLLLARFLGALASRKLFMQLMT